MRDVLQDVSHGNASGYISYNDVKTVTSTRENLDFIDFTETKLGRIGSSFTQNASGQGQS